MLIKYLTEQTKIEETAQLPWLYGSDYVSSEPEVEGGEEEVDFEDEEEIDLGIHYTPEFRAPGPFKVIKKQSRYVCLWNNHFKFLDIMLFLPAGTNLDQFLKSFNNGCRKWFFPYEFMDDVTKLQADLPPYPSRAWYSNLKDVDLLDEEHQAWERKGKIGEEPPNGYQKFQQVQKLWTELGCQNLGQYLLHYNKSDVAPAIAAIQALQEEFFNEGVDLCADAITAPGISRRKLYAHAKMKGECIPLIHQKDLDYHQQIRHSICGGIALIFKRFCKAGQTAIRPGSTEKSHTMVSYDANCLYLSCFAGYFPINILIRRRRENGFKPEINKRVIKQFVWLNHMQRVRNVTIKTSMSMGREVR